jgi:hypothetical protein
MVREMITPHEVNTTHGNDVGVWVCEGSGILISPCLFIQSVCPAQAPLSVSVKWRQAGPPPKFFRKSEAIPLLYGECGRIPHRQSYLHLFSIEVPATRPFERESVLRDWQFPVRMVGVVVLWDKRSDDTAAYQFLSAFKPSIQSKNRTLDWAKVQRLAFVIATMGYGIAPFSEDQFRRRYGLASHVPIVPGPSLVDGSLQSMGRRGTNAQAERSILPIFGGRKLSFDSEYAKQVLGALCKVVETNE